MRPCALSLGAHRGRLCTSTILVAFGGFVCVRGVHFGAWVLPNNIHPSILMPLMCEENFGIWGVAISIFLAFPLCFCGFLAFVLCDLAYSWYPL